MQESERSKEVTSMWLLSLVAIVLGLVVAIFDADLFMPPLHWFALAIALALLKPGRLPSLRR
jgi:hypothetical protein